MKKLLLCFLFLPLSLYASSHESCTKYTDDYTTAFVISKNINPLNILHFGVSLNKTTCQFEQLDDKPLVVPFWKMGHKVIDTDHLCEDITRKEVGSLLGYNSHKQMYEKMTRKIDDQTIELSIPVLEKFGSKISRRTVLSPILTLKAQMLDDKCVIQTVGSMNSEDFEFDKLYVYIRFLSVRSVNIYYDEESILD